MENDWPESRYAKLKIGFVFDAHRNWEKAEKAYEYLKSHNSICRKRMLVACHADDKEYPGLQMADLLAYECRLRTNEWRKGSPQERESLAVLREAHNLYFMGFMGKTELLKEMAKSSSYLE